MAVAPERQPPAVAPSTPGDDASPPAAPPVFSTEELSAYVGKPKGTPIYIAILGDVFDVTSGQRFYGKGQGYEHFAGRDASRAYATGDSTGEGLTDDVAGLPLDDLKAISGWHDFYVQHENYTFVGVVVGRHYDANGTNISTFPWARLKVQEERAAAIKAALPDCNSRWTQADGSELWCTTRSGGVEREWVGVPRVYDPSRDPALEDDGATGERCVCAPPEEVAKAPPYLREYAGCEPTAERCFVKK